LLQIISTHCHPSHHYYIVLICLFCYINCCSPPRK
jgi:hypothetical protein